VRRQRRREGTSAAVRGAPGERGPLHARSLRLCSEASESRRPQRLHHLKRANGCCGGAAWGRHHAGAGGGGARRSARHFGVRSSRACEQARLRNRIACTQALHSAQEEATRRRAESWLEAFQESPDAWQVRSLRCTCCACISRTSGTNAMVEEN